MSLDVVIPQIGESITHVFISQWLAKAGDYIEEGSPILEIDSDKASLEVPSPASGVLVETLVGEEDEVEIGAVVARLDTSAERPAGDTKAAPAPAADEAPTAGNVKAGPAARNAANEKGVDLGAVSGTGPKGRVTTGDVTRAATGSAPAATDSAATTPTGRVTRRKMTPLRRTIARRLVEAQQTAAMLTTFNEVDMGPIMALRKKYQPQFVDKYGIKLGFMSFFVKAVIEGLKAFPAVNSEIDGNEIIYKHFYNIGVAVSGPKGLVVPVIRDADALGFAETEQAISNVAKRARDNKLTIKDFTDGTFTISNGGIFGSMMSTPILNPPQVGILGMHNIIQRPMVVDGKVEIRPMMYLALSYDHRIIDGREAVSFLVRVKECLESPERVMLEV